MESIHRNQLDEMIKGFFRGKLLCATVRLGLADGLGDGRRSDHGCPSVCRRIHLAIRAARLRR